MWPDRWPAFVGVLVIILCVPGPDFFVIVRHSLTDVRAGMRAAAGNLTGLLVHTALAAAGVSTLLAAKPALLGAIRLAGAGYLAWLGVVALRACLPRSGEPNGMRLRLPGRRASKASGTRSTPETGVTGTMDAMPPGGWDPGSDLRGAGPDAAFGGSGLDASEMPGSEWGMSERKAHPFRDGLATNLLNPKAVLFFVGVIPQFVSPDGSVTVQTLFLAATTLAFVVMWWTTVVTVVGRGIQPLLGPGAERMFNGVSAVALLGLAASFVVAAF
ncbi:LysE family translocator [Phytoactinopolyspora endophytica]|uniref:LysE family translocator n=1 Tax=Phytoactinopolyspora endophytica TaxID=1642495 RepID=UPI00101DD71D|nr:LysE family translocator [Phytoactinopolyspora endophytica]